MLSLDSPGFWNVRTENLDTWYLGQETYIRVVDPDGGYNVTEMVAPDNMLYCGLLKDKQKYVASILLMCFREYSSYFAFDLTGVMTNASTVFFFGPLGLRSLMVHQVHHPLLHHQTAIGLQLWCLW